MTAVLNKCYEGLVEIFNLEIAALRDALRLQKSVQTAVLLKEWKDFESLSADLNSISLKLQALEAERLALFKEYFTDFDNKNSEFFFFEIAGKLPYNEREALTKLYRTLKNECVKLKLLNKAWTEYLLEIKELSEAFLSAIIPERKTKLYGRSGVLKNSEIRNLVLDRQV